MGLCGSCEADPAVRAPMSKLILDDGQLQEFSYPVKVSQLLLHLRNIDVDPTFICNSDNMGFDDLLMAMGPDEALLPGGLYFELPGDWLARRLRAEEMACLAVKASVALKSSSNSNGGVNYKKSRCGGGGRWCFGCGGRDVGSSEIFPVVFSGEVEGGEREVMLKRGRTSGGGGSRFSASLGVILEE